MSKKEANERIKQLSLATKETFLNIYQMQLIYVKEKDKLTKLSRFTKQYLYQNLQRELNCPCTLFYLIKIDRQIIGYLKIKYDHKNLKKRLYNRLEIVEIFISENSRRIDFVLLLWEKVEEIVEEQEISIISLSTAIDLPNHIYKKYQILDQGEKII